jgi:uncharacterized protein
MGILAMNIVNFGWPGGVYSIPILAPDYGNGDLILWGLNHLFFDTKMMTLFSMLFGAGLVLMSDRAASRKAKVGWIYYRRVFWLLMIGLVHSYLIWDGDILVMYASCGFLLFLFRKLSARTLLITGICFNLVFVPLLIGFRLAGIPYMQRTADRVEAQEKAKAQNKTKTKADEKPSFKDKWDQGVAEAWKNMSKNEMPKREDFLKDIATYRGSYVGIVKDRAKGLIFGQTLGFILGGWWLAGGRMLIGMGLMKLGVFSAERSQKTYQKMMLYGYGIGLPLMLFDTFHQSFHGFFLGRQLWYALDGWPFLTFYGSLPVVVGHIGLIMLICQSNALPWLTRRLGAAGRMALSCYLFDSIACSTFFYGYGFDFYGSLHRPLLYAIVITIWTGQLLICPLWLEHFRYGPAEWLWRSLTYWKPQSMRVKSV